MGECRDTRRGRTHALGVRHFLKVSNAFHRFSLANLAFWHFCPPSDRSPSSHDSGKLPLKAPFMPDSSHFEIVVPVFPKRFRPSGTRSRRTRREPSIRISPDTASGRSRRRMPVSPSVGLSSTRRPPGNGRRKPSPVVSRKPGKRPNRPSESSCDAPSPARPMPGRRPLPSHGPGPCTVSQA